jgi:hypothetical protein
MAALAALALLAAAALGGGCSSERTAYDLAVTAAPNPVASTPDGTGRRWDYAVTIANPLGTAVRVAYYHTGISGTDTGYTQGLLLVDDSPIVGARIPPGGQVTYAGNRVSGGRFATGTERRVYHALGDDGNYYSGEVLIELR